MPTITIYRPGQPVEVIERDVAGYPTLKTLQEWVGGYIQPVYYPDDPCGYWHVGYANENGLALRLPYNAQASSLCPQYPHGFLGPVVFLDGFQRFWWHDADSWEPVRVATRKECLRASRSGVDTIQEDGRELILGEREERRA